MMRQYRELKARHPKDILFFRLGDFYEMFEEDAKTASRVLGLTLTSRSKGEGSIPMAGIPAHASETYLRRLLAAGHRVAICEQLEDPAATKGMLQRGVVRIVTPGTVFEEGMLEARRNTWLAAVHVEDAVAGLAWADCSTGEFRVTEVSRHELMDVLSRLGPAEVLVSESRLGRDPEALKALELALGFPVTPWGDWAFAKVESRRALLEQLKAASLEAFGCEDLVAGLQAAGALLAYLKDTQRGALGPFRTLVREKAGESMALDRATLSGLEVLTTARGGNAEGSLLSVLDRTQTAMGARTLRRWLGAPLVDLAAIRLRHDAVDALVSDAVLRKSVRTALREVYDLERLSGRLAAGRANARDALAVASSLTPLPALRESLARQPSLAPLGARLEPLESLSSRVERTIRPDAPLSITEGALLRDGQDAELDRLKAILRDGDDWLVRFEKEEAARTGIPSLKVERHRVFGLLISVTNVHGAKVPSDYIRRQTLKNAERYTTVALQAREAEVLGAEREAASRELALFLELRQALAEALPSLQRTSSVLSELDALASLADAAADRGYVRPQMCEEPLTEIREGRHPSIEAKVHPFVPNDTVLAGALRGLVVTGPNMAGKSTYIRQVALLQLMAQAGSFVPARSARLGVADRIFARAGSVDDLSRAQSTFLVEMSETAYILRHATRRSLAVLDEIGRGTSTYDGVSIAWAVAEALAVKTGCRTLFATHYHELAALAQEHPGIVANACVAVREEAGGITFLHRIQAGSADRSYGLHVAALAGVPSEVTARAKGILAVLEGQGRELAQRMGGAEQVREKAQPPEDPLRAGLQALSPERMTPLEALTWLTDLKKRLDDA